MIRVFTGTIHLQDRKSREHSLTVPELRSLIRTTLQAGIRLEYTGSSGTCCIGGMFTNTATAAAATVLHGVCKNRTVDNAGLVGVVVLSLSFLFIAVGDCVTCWGNVK